MAVPPASDACAALLSPMRAFLYGRAVSCSIACARTHARPWQRGEIFGRRHATHVDLVCAGAAARVVLCILYCTLSDPAENEKQGKENGRAARKRGDRKRSSVVSRVKDRCLTRRLLEVETVSRKRMPDEPCSSRECITLRISTKPSTPEKQT